MGADTREGIGGFQKPHTGHPFRTACWAIGMNKARSLDLEISFSRWSSGWGQRAPGAISPRSRSGCYDYAFLAVCVFLQQMHVGKLMVNTVGISLLGGHRPSFLMGSSLEAEGLGHRTAVFVAVAGTVQPV